MTVPAFPFSYLYIPGRTYDPTAALSTPTGIGTTFYVDGGANGNDTNDGQSMTPGEGHGPRKTINKGIELLTQPGDRLLIKGGIYYTHDDIVKCNATGANEDNPFIIGPYNGEEVIIDPSLQVSGWESYDAPNNIWRIDVSAKFTGDQTTLDGKYPKHVVINYEYYYQEMPRAGCATALDALIADPATMTDGIAVPTNQRWCYDGSQYVYVRTTLGDPDAQDVGIIYTDGITGKYSVKVEQSNYRIYGLTGRFAPAVGFMIYKSGGPRPQNVSFEWCRAFYSGWAGLKSGGDYCKFYKSLVYRCTLSNYPLGRISTTGGWDPHIALASVNHNEIEGCISIWGGGEGINSNGYDGDTYNKIFNNIVLACTTGGYIDSEGELDYYGNLVIGRKPEWRRGYNIEAIYNKEHTTLGVTWGASYTNEFIRKQRGKGCSGGDETGNNKYKNVRYYNNILYNVRLGYEFNATADVAYDASMVNIYFVNNTVILPAASDLLGGGIESATSGTTVLLGISFGEQVNGVNSGVYCQNNIFYRSNSADVKIGKHADSYPPNEDSMFNGITINYNVICTNNIATDVAFFWYYHTESSPHTGTYDWWLNHRHDNAGTHGLGDVLGDPQLAGGALPLTYTDYLTDVDPDDFAPASDTSAVVGKGTTPPFAITTDFFGNPRVNRYDIGAVQYYPGYTPVTPLGIEGGQPAGMPGGKVDGI